MTRHWSMNQKKRSKLKYNRNPTLSTVVGTLAKRSIGTIMEWLHKLISEWIWVFILSNNTYFAYLLLGSWKDMYNEATCITWKVWARAEGWRMGMRSSRHTYGTSALRAMDSPSWAEPRHKGTLFTAVSLLFSFSQMIEGQKSDFNRTRLRTKCSCLTYEVCLFSALEETPKGWIL